jgi:CheY-like chemotaxis protein
LGQKARCDEELVMMRRILVVEDEIFVATEIEHVIEEMGLTPIGIAPDERSALALASQADVALVDLNLRDGATGIRIGHMLTQAHGVTVLFMTANPAQLGDGVPGTVGVLSKPVTEPELRAALAYAVARHDGTEVAPPARLRLFERPAALDATG